jgi:hypothetical protein
MNRTRWALMFFTVVAQTLLGQSNQSGPAVGIDAAQDIQIVRGQPFSAISYVRRMEVSDNGKPEFIRNERYPLNLARDSDGRVRLDIVLNPSPDCNQLTLPIPPPCPYKHVILFDPAAQTITHWQDAEQAGRAAAVIRLSAPQLHDAEAATSQPPADEPREQSSERVAVTVEDLGTRDINGIVATGRRTTTMRWKDSLRTGTPVIRIHEIWRSPLLDLVVRVIDGDPKNQEVISGLDHFSADPDPSLFHAPDGWPLYSRNQSDLLDQDVTLLGSWFLSVDAAGK